MRTALALGVVGLAACSSPSSSPPASSEAPSVRPSASATWTATAPPGCYGTKIPLERALTNDACRTKPTSAPKPAGPHVHARLDGPTTATPGGHANLRLRIENDDDAPAVLWFTPKAIEASTTLVSSPVFAVTTSDAKGRVRNQLSKTTTPPTNPAPIRLELGPHGVALAPIAWAATGYPDPNDVGPAVAPTGDTPREVAKSGGKELARVSDLVTPRPLPPGSYHVVVDTGLAGVDPVAADVTVAP